MMEQAYLKGVANRVFQECESVWVSKENKSSGEYVGVNLLGSDKEYGPMHDVQSVEDGLKVHQIVGKLTNNYSRFGGVGGFKLGWKNFNSDYKALFCPVVADCIVNDGSKVNISKYNVHAAEAELGFVMKRSFLERDTEYTPAEVYEHVENIHLCIELCGRRKNVFKSKAGANKFNDVADLLLGAIIIKGPSIGKPENSDTLSNEKANFSLKPSNANTALNIQDKNSYYTLLDEGTGKNNPFDSPLSSLTYLVNQLYVHRRKTKKHNTKNMTLNEVYTIEPGMLVITGHCCRVWLKNECVPPAEFVQCKWKNGDKLVADFNGLGNVSVTLK